MDGFSKARCTEASREVITAQILHNAGILPSDIYATVENIKTLALLASGQTDSPCVELPFCHTVEALALGADIRPADETAGPRPGRYTLESPAQLMPTDIAASAQAEQLLAACAALTKEGKQVVYQLSGPLSILSCLLNLSAWFKCWRKTPEVAEQCLQDLQKMLLHYAAALCKSGVAVLAYADPAGGPDILGPKYNALLTAQFTLPFLRRLLPLCGKRCSVIICPLTAAALSRQGCLRVVRPGDGLLTVGCIKHGCTPHNNISLIETEDFL